MLAPPDALPPPTVDLPIAASDGERLDATLTGDADAAGAPVVLVASALGVRRRFYQPFAAHLAGHEGMRVLTWDWWGSTTAPPCGREGRATLRHWGERDLAGIIAWAAAEWPGAPLVALGHSFGGQSVGMAPNAGALSALVTVAAQSGYWGHWPRPARYGFAALWHVAVPAATHLFGHLPGWMMGGGGLPAEAALEWARWCRRPEYLGDYVGHARFGAPILAVSIADDRYAPAAAVDALHAEYRGAEITRRVVRPAEVGTTRLGHFGLFRPGETRPLWREIAAWIRDVARRERDGA